MKGPNFFFIREFLGSQSINPLENLRAVQIPPILDRWELAPGWWFLSFLLFFFIFFLFWLFAKTWRNKKYRREALIELEAIDLRRQKTGDDLVFLQESQTLLKRVALTAFPREKVAQLTDLEWINFLGRSSKKSRFEDPVAEVLIDDIYREKLDQPLNHHEIKALLRFWIKNHKAIVPTRPNKND